MKYKTLYASAACLLLSVVFAGLTFKKHLDYREEQPLITTLNKEACKGSGLVGFWKFDEVNHDVTPDQSMHAHPGLFQMKVIQLSWLLFGYPKLVDGRVGKALQFSGRQWVSAGNDRCFTSEQFTIASWVWQESDDEQGVIVPTIMAKSAWPSNGWWLCSTSKGIQAATRYIDVGISWGSERTHIQSGYQLPLKEWHHVAVTLDNISHQAQFYIDGRSFGPLHTNVPHWLTNWDHDLFIGDYDGSGRWPWVGKLDEVRLYNRVLSAEDISSIYSGVEIAPT